MHAFQSAVLSAASAQKPEPPGILERGGKSAAQAVLGGDLSALRSGKQTSGLGPDPMVSAIFWHGGLRSSQLLQPTHAAPSVHLQ